jgi:hypothetical protein
MKYLIVFLSIFFIGCNQNLDNDKIILTTGLGMNPDLPRFGVLVKDNMIYYCEEIITNKGNYNYYETKSDSDIFLDLKNKIDENFKSEIIFKPIVDAEPFQLNVYFGEEKKVMKFYLTFLNKSQIKVINDIVALKKLKFKKINYYDFPKELLTERLPKPPVPSSAKSPDFEGQ